MAERLGAEVEERLYEDVDGEGVVTRLGHLVSVRQRILYILQYVKDVLGGTLRLYRSAQTMGVVHSWQLYR